MSDFFYNFVHTLGSAIFWSTARPVVMHRDRVPRKSAFLLASTHLSPFDVPILLRHTPRKLDFVSIVEVFRNPFVAWFYGSMNAFPLDRSKPDGPTVRIIMNRLRKGRPIAIFPEGGIRRFESSVINGGKIRPGVARLAQMAEVPVVPAIVLDGHFYARVRAWLPARQVRYGVIYGKPLMLRSEMGKAGAAASLEGELREAFIVLYKELADAMSQRGILVTHV